MPNADKAHPFISTFGDIWADPTLDGLMSSLRDDVRLVQPLSAPLEGKAAARLAFKRILHQFPGLRGEVKGGLGEGSLVFIDWAMIAPVGGREIAIPVIDKFTLQDDMVKERVAYFDPTPVSRAVLRSPSSLMRSVTAQFIRRG